MRSFSIPKSTYPLVALGMLGMLVTFFIVMVHAAEAEDISQAVAVLHSAQGHNIDGTVTFQKTSNGVRILATIKGLTPGKHGFHIHAFGDCSASDFTSAGGHYNPDGYPHAGPASKKRHMGDLGNVTADADGEGHFEASNDYVALDGSRSVIGRAVIVHAGEDDLTSQPSGDAGARVACGVIGISGQ